MVQQKTNVAFLICMVQKTVHQSSRRNTNHQSKLQKLSSCHLISWTDCPLLQVRGLGKTVDRREHRVKQLLYYHSFTFTSFDKSRTEELSLLKQNVALYHRVQVRWDVGRSLASTND